MTNEQYENWKDFSRRMARTCFGHLRMRPSKQWVIDQVESWFEGFDERDIPCVRSWDNSDDYPEGHDFYRKTFRALCWHCVQKGLPIGSSESCRCENGNIYDYAMPYCMGDRMSSHWDDIEPAFHCSHCCKQPHWLRIKWEDACRCDEIVEIARNQWHDQWASHVECCIRAGLDMASEPSMGVIGFTAGDLRRMYPEGVPAWIFPPNERLRYWGTDKLNGTFAELPDDAGVVL